MKKLIYKFKLYLPTIFLILIANAQIVKAEVFDIENTNVFDTLCYYDTCAVIVDSGRTVFVNSDLVTTYIRVFNGCTLFINSGVTVTLIGDVHPENELILYGGGTITGPGLLKTYGNQDPVHDVIMEIHENSVFDVEVKSSSGRAVFMNAYNENFISLNKKITIDPGAQMLYSGSSGLSRLTVYGNILNNGKMWSIAGLINFKGQSITNNDSIHAVIEIDTNCYINGAGAWLCTYLYVMPYRTLYLGNNVSLSVRNFILQPNANVNLNTFSLTFRDYAFYNYTDVLMYDMSLISNGQIYTNGTGVRLSIDTTGSVSVPLTADSGNIIIGTLFGGRTIFDTTVSINANATFNCSNEILFKDNVVNNGYISLNFCVFRGGNFVNNGNVCSGVFDFESDCNLSGSGFWTCGSYTYLKSTRTMTLGSDVNFRNSFFEIDPDAILNLNGYDFNLDHLDGTSGYLIVDSAATITGEGEIVSKGFPNIYHVNILNHYYSNFNSKLRAASGLLNVSSIPSGNKKTIINKSIIVDSGAILSTLNYNDTLIARDSIINNGTLTGSYKLSGNALINNGIITSADFYFGSNFSNALPQTLQGTGSFTEPSNCIITNGASIILISTHQIFNLRIDSGGTFDISNQILKISGIGTESIANNGSFITTGSTIEFNRQNSYQFFPVSNINYNNVHINNPNGVFLSGHVTLPALLTLSDGNLDLNGFIITLTPNATLQETPGNTVKGNDGYITTTRNIIAPSNLNVAGMGAILTTSSNLGMTEIRRGHSVQYGLAGNQSIARYFDIEPANNSNLNATLGFKYDYSELDTMNESELGLYKSTNAGLNYSFTGGTADTVINQITLSGIDNFSRWSAGEYSFPMPSVITLIIEGLLDENTYLLNSADTVYVYLADAESPYNIVDSSRGQIDSVNYTGEFLFSNAPSGIYYIIVKHRNGIETWSKSGGETYNVGKVLSYDFTIAQTQAFGDNLKLKAARWCIYSGDVNQDGIIDGGDLLVIDNDAYNFVSGYAQSDVNGDGIVDGSDANIAGNNSDNFVSVERP